MLRKVFLLIMMILFALSLWSLVRAGSTFKPPPLLYIPNTDQSTIIREITAQGVPFGMIDYRLFKRYNYQREGWVRFNSKKRLSREDLVQKVSRPERETTRRIVMYSGDPISFFLRRVAKLTDLPYKKLRKTYKKLSPYPDGGIMADYYYLPYDTNIKATLYYLISLTENRFRRLAEEHLGSYDPKKWKRILTVASIIQKETAKAYEMPMVASVIYNRLERGIKLQMDATLNYGRYAHTPVTPKRIRKDKTHFNTYRYKGLPKEPIGSITEPALLAALKPAQTDHLYFVRNVHNAHDFADTYADHLANICRTKVYKARLRRVLNPPSN